MPWNEPGGNGNKNNDPWGGKNNNSPPDLDKLFSDFIKKLRNLFNTKKNGPYRVQPSSTGPSGSKDHHYGIGITLAVLVALWVLSGLFIVNPAEETVILRFGKYHEVLQPGLHWMARFIDSKYTVDVQKIYSFSLHGDFLTKSSEQSDLPTQITVAGAPSDQSKNLVTVELNVQYRINNPRNYLFNVVNPDGTVQQVVAGALSDVIGKMKLDEVLTTGRETLSSGVLARSRDILKNYNAGIEVLSVTLRKIQAPDQVRAAFNDVNRADQDKATYIQQAQAYASKVVPLAQGFAARTLADANAYQQQVVLGAQANVAKYLAISKAYAGAPEVTRERLYLEAIQNILMRTTKVLVDGNLGNNMLYLPLDKLMAPKAEAPAVTDNANVPSPQIMPTINTASQPGNVEVKNVTN